MQKKLIVSAMVALAANAAKAKGVEYECDDGRSDSGYRIRVVELSRDLHEVLVLKKTNGSARLLENRKLKRVGGSASAPEFSSGKTGRRLSFRRSEMDANGNWTGTFEIPGARTVRASCGRVETISL